MGTGAGVGGVGERADKGEGTGAALVGVASDMLPLLEIGVETDVATGAGAGADGGGAACVPATEDPFSKLM